MIIAVEIRFTEAYQNFIYETFKRITGYYPQHTFLFIFDKPFGSSFYFSKNIMQEVVLQAKDSLLSRISANHKRSSLLRKYKADVFITAQPLLQTNIPQCLIACDKFTAKSLKKACAIITASEFSKKEIIAKYNIDVKKIDTVYKGADEIFKPIPFEKKDIIKNKYAEGNEYFLISATGVPEDLLNLLKAFSIFKKRQKSNMQLLIVSQTNFHKEILEMLRLYKYNTEVKIIVADKKELALIIGAAYAFINPFACNHYTNILAAMKCDVPVIANNTGIVPQICGDAALYCNYTQKDIADKMMLIYKDEKQRKEIIEKGKIQVKKYSWDKSAEMLWESIVKVTH